jgi:hypothetical protein
MATVELFKYNKFYTTINNSSIKNFTIYGERHSGTKWLEKLISRSFDIPVTWKYEHKHFFGCCDWEKLNIAKNTLFIGIVRNIYNWIGGMRKMPYHLSSKNVIDIRPWQSNIGITPHGSFCDSHWYTKKKYADIFDMRSDKVEFLYLYMPYLVDNYIFIRYEDLIENTKDILQLISILYKLNIHKNKYQIGDKSKIPLYKLSEYYFKSINDRTKWKTENMIGYSKILQPQENYRVSKEYGLSSRYR